MQVCPRDVLCAVTDLPTDEVTPRNNVTERTWFSWIRNSSPVVKHEGTLPELEEAIVQSLLPTAVFTYWPNLVL
jgi:hypothetical protein